MINPSLLSKCIRVIYLRICVKYSDIDLRITYTYVYYIRRCGSINCLFQNVDLRWYIRRWNYAGLYFKCAPTEGCGKCISFTHCDSYKCSCLCSYVAVRGGILGRSDQGIYYFYYVTNVYPRFCEHSAV